jgi:predicted heme/steroid binding protein
MDGYVYDVSLGSKYYGPGGVYHKIAGTDATALLHVFGSSIIREKYPIVGVLSD